MGAKLLKRRETLFALVAVCGCSFLLTGSATIVVAGSLAASTTTSKTAHAVSPNPVGHKRIPAPDRVKVHPFETGSSSLAENWSGYADSAPGGTFTAITGTFTVPTVSVTGTSDQFSSDWLGIGGYSDGSLIQAGIEADSINGSAFYDAWTEVLPAFESPVHLKIRPGDTVAVTIVETSANRWKMEVADESTGRQVTRKVRYQSSGSSAEAITERPCLNTCSSVADLANLTQTTPSTFDLVMAATSSPGKSPSYEPLLSAPGASTLEDISMVDDTGTNVIATPSNSDSDSDGFTVGDGANAPAAPPS